MQLFVRNKFTIQSCFNVNEINKILNGIITKKMDVIDISVYTAKTPFIGDVNSSGFSIIPTGIKVYLFRPMSIGEYIETAEGTEIIVKQEISLLGNIFLLLWILIGGIAFGIGISNDIITACVLTLVVMIWPCIERSRIVREMNRIQQILIAILGRKDEYVKIKGE